MPQDAAQYHPEPITVLYDGQCPICRREIHLLEKHDRRGIIRKVDIAGPDFDPAAYGLTHEQTQARIHGILPDSRVIDSMDVLRYLYAAVGRGWMLAWTRWPGLRWLADRAYDAFARHRYRITFRSRPACDDDRCTINRNATRAQHDPAHQPQ